MQHDLSSIRTWILDLDNTLYSPYCNVFPQIHTRMEAYIMQYFSISSEEAAVRRKRYFYEYGTSLRGMMVEEKIDADHFLDFVHDIDYSAITPQPELKALLAGLEGDKIIFTNADSRHAVRVLRYLGLDEALPHIFDIADGDYVCKPQPEPYQRLLARYGAAAQTSCMIDDMEANLKTAAAIGMTTVWMRHEADWLRHPPGPAADYPHCHYTTDDLIPFFRDLNGRSA
jgi:putative hydrolase of the HAD superfamily